MSAFTVVPATVTDTEVLLNVVDWKAVGAKEILAGPKSLPKTTKMEPCAMPALGSPGVM